MSDHPLDSNLALSCLVANSHIASVSYVKFGKHDIVEVLLDH